MADKIKWSDWFDHDGSIIDLHGDHYCQVQLRNGKELAVFPSMMQWTWLGDESPFDIVKYRNIL